MLYDAILCKYEYEYDNDNNNDNDNDNIDAILCDIM